jgi:hypothetical protein
MKNQYDEDEREIAIRKQVEILEKEKLKQSERIVKIKQIFNDEDHINEDLIKEEKEILKVNNLLRSKIRLFIIKYFTIRFTMQFIIHAFN